MLRQQLIIRVLLLCGLTCFTFVAQAQWVNQSWSQMGTRISVKLWADTPEQAKQSVQLVKDEMRRIDYLMSPYIKSSELAKINRVAAQAPVTISREMLRLIQQANQIAEISGGIFDITYASVGYRYNFRQHRKPDPATISKLLPAINYKFIQLDNRHATVKFLHPLVKIDLGGIAKGYAVQNAIKQLQAIGVQYAVVTAGGDSQLLGDKRGKPWLVGIQDPRHAQQNAVVLPLSNVAMSTSGDYERYFIENGKRYHHIISPTTGTPARNNRSVTIIGQNATITDALSTTLFILNYDKGLKLLEKFPGYDAIIIDKSGKLHYSSGLQRSN